jgi:fluoride exporter
MNNILLVGLGGALGSMLRYATTLLLPVKDFPIATLLVNVIGSFIIGVVIALSVKDHNFSANWKLFLSTGICGGFTTFSAFSLENVSLFQNGKYMLALSYILLSITLGIAATWLGFKMQ